MKTKLLSLFVVSLMTSPLASGERRWAVLEAHGPIAAASPLIALVESRVVDDLTGQLTSVKGITVVDRANIDKLLKEQNFQNSDRSSPGTAVRIGKLLGVGEIVLVQVYDFSYTVHNERHGLTTYTIGTVVLRANARLIDVGTGVVEAQPSSSFQDSVEISKTRQPLPIGPVVIPSKQQSSDPRVIVDKECAKASETVVRELAAKLTSALPVAAGPETVKALVAGIANGNVYINRGIQHGIKTGDKFQVVREAGVGLNDPETGKPIVHRLPVCILTITNVDQASASGACQGGIPQTNDVAEPFQ
ncbi:MAG: FlgT C-terminal domain-containing protein [Bryobacteraceae bacterium]